MQELKEFFPIDQAACEVTSNFNTAPSQEIPAIIRDSGQNCLVRLHWGLVPFWAKDISIGNRMINARAESIAEKPSFRNAFKKRRCLIPADGYYEWQGEKGRKQPLFITLPDRKPFAFAGIWESRGGKSEQGPPYRSCSIISTESSGSIRRIHHRMPVILNPAAYERWLDAGLQDAAQLDSLLKDEILTELVSYPVSKRVNSVGNNDPSCIEPIE